MKHTSKSSSTYSECILLSIKKLQHIHPIGPNQIGFTVLRFESNKPWDRTVLKKRHGIFRKIHWRYGSWNDSCSFVASTLDWLVVEPPIWKIWTSNWVHLPQVGVKIKNVLKPPPSRCCWKRSNNNPPGDHETCRSSTWMENEACWPPYGVGTSWMKENYQTWLPNFHGKKWHVKNQPQIAKVSETSRQLHRTSTLGNAD